MREKCGRGQRACVEYGYDHETDELAIGLSIDSWVDGSDDANRVAVETPDIWERLLDDMDIDTVRCAGSDNVELRWSTDHSFSVCDGDGEFLFHETAGGIRKAIEAARSTTQTVDSAIHQFVDGHPCIHSVEIRQPSEMFKHVSDDAVRYVYLHVHNSGDMPGHTSIGSRRVDAEETFENAGYEIVLSVFEWANNDDYDVLIGAEVHER